MGKYSRPQEKSKLPVLLGIAILILLLILGGVFACTAMGRDDGAGEEDAVFVPDLEENVAQWDQRTEESVTDPTEAPRIAIPGFPRVTIKADSEEVTLPFYNPEENRVYFTFTLVLKDSGEVLYQSRQVAPGQGLTTVKLNRALEAGEYKAVLQVTTNSVADGSPKNGANLDTLLIAK